MRVAYILVALVAISIILYSCFESDTEKRERLAKTYCGACHLFPEPSLLDKKTWEQGIMPRMAFRMGLDNFGILEVPVPDQETVASIIPPAIVNQEEWQLIKDYYRLNAPDSLPSSVQPSDSLTLFEPQPIKLGNESLLVTLLQADEDTKTIWIGTRLSNLYRTGFDLNILDTISLKSPPSQLEFKNEELTILEMGIMDPNDRPAGSLIKWKNNEGSKLIDSLKRPVYFKSVDFNQDDIDDYIICAFGNFTGSFLIYESDKLSGYRKHIIENAPGSRIFEVKDFDEDGDLDIMTLLTQGDERIQLYLNEGNYKFKIKTLLRFPPVYGSNYFQTADFNKDGKLDIIYTNGDNADYSGISKPYHGIRIFLNEGNYSFKESFFYNMHGASQTSIFDFDSDGDLDIAAIAFFPNFKKGETGFVYLENKGSDFNFIPYTTAITKDARWLRMTIADIDQDDDKDIILGSLNFPIGAPVAARDRWKQKNITLLVLKNKSN